MGGETSGLTLLCVAQAGVKRGDQLLAATGGTSGPITGVGSGTDIPLGGRPLRGEEMSDRGISLAKRGLASNPSKAGPAVMHQQGCGNSCT